MNGTFFFLWFLPDLVPRPSLPSFGEGPCDAWERSRHHLGKVVFHAPDLPHRNAPTVPPDTDSPGKVPNLKFDLPQISLPPSPFTLGTFPIRPQDLSRSLHRDLSHLPSGPPPIHSTGTCPICPQDLPSFTPPGPVPFAFKTPPHSLPRDLSHLPSRPPLIHSPGIVPEGR